MRTKAFFTHFESRAREIGLQDRFTVFLRAEYLVTRIGFYSTLKAFQALYAKLLERPIFNEYGEKLAITKAELNHIIYGWDCESRYEGHWQKQNRYHIRLMALHAEGKTFDQIATIMNDEFSWVDIFKRGKWTANSARALIEERLAQIKREAALGFSSTLADGPLK